MPGHPHNFVKRVAFRSPARSLDIVQTIATTVLVQAAIVTINIALILCGELLIPLTLHRFRVEEDSIRQATIVLCALSAVAVSMRPLPDNLIYKIPALPAEHGVADQLQLFEAVGSQWR